MGNEFVRGTLAFLKNSVITLFSRPETEISAVTELENLNAMETSGSQGGRSQVAAFTSQRKGDRQKS